MINPSANPNKFTPTDHWLAKSTVVEAVTTAASESLMVKLTVPRASYVPACPEISKFDKEARPNTALAAGEEMDNAAEASKLIVKVNVPKSEAVAPVTTNK